jgi:cell division protein ZapA (FtsZ GTPase activity inhibitor)
MSETRADVEILGQRLTIRGQGSAEHIRSLADYLDGRIRSVREQARVYDPVRLSLLAGLHVADELFRSREREARLLAQVDALSARLGAALAEAEPRAAGAPPRGRS